MPPNLSPAEELSWRRKYREVLRLHRETVRREWFDRPNAWLCDRDECDGLPHDRWVTNHCRKIPGRSQALPEGRWRVVYKIGGRGSGKTRSAAEGFADLILSSEPGEWAVVAPTFGDARDVCMAGPSGLIVALGGQAGPGGVLIKTGPWIRPHGWHVSTGQLDLIDGSKIYCDGADDGGLRIQGRNLRGCLADEIGLWKQWRTAWDESIRFAVRLSPAKIIVAGTPKANRDARELVRRLLDDPAVPVDRLRTEDNAANLDPEQLEDWLLAKGTRMAAQELEGELLRDREGALVAWDDIIPYRVTEEDLPVMRRVLVSVDPSFSNSETSDECGIVAVGEGADDHHAYILADWSGRYSIDTWSKRAVLLAWFLSANAIIYESNLVGNIVRTNLESAITDFLTRPEAWGDPDLAREMMQLGLDGKPTNWVPPRLKPVQAKLPKLGRLEVVAPLWQQHRVHHLITVDGSGAELTQDILENQITSWVPEDGDSPDRMDAATAGVAELGLHKRRPRRRPSGLMTEVVAQTV